MNMEITLKIKKEVVPHYEREKFLVSVESLMASRKEIDNFSENLDGDIVFNFLPNCVNDVEKSDYYLKQICLGMELIAYYVYETYFTKDGLELYQVDIGFDKTKLINKYIEFSEHKKEHFAFGESKKEIKYYIIDGKKYKLEKND